MRRLCCRKNKKAGPTVSNSTATSSESAAAPLSINSSLFYTMDLHVHSSSTLAAAASASPNSPPSFLSPENVASVPPPGLSAPSQLVFLPNSSLLSYVAVLPKASSQKSRSGSSTRSLYRPLTTSSAVAAVQGNAAASTSPTKSTMSVTSNPTERILMCLDLQQGCESQPTAVPLLQWITPSRGGRNTSKRRALTDLESSSALSLEERLRRERQRISTAAGSLTQFSWVLMSRSSQKDMLAARRNGDNTTEIEQDNVASRLQNLRLLVPARGSLYIQNGIDWSDETDSDTPECGIHCTCIHDKSATGMSATDAQLSPDGSMVAWTFEGELYVQSAEPTAAIEEPPNSTDDCSATTTPAIRISFGASQTEACSISHGVADFVAQEEMDRYRGFWWHPDSTSILFTRNDESEVPLYRIMHHSNASSLPSSSSSMQNDQSSSQHNESSSSCHGFASPKSNSSSFFEDHRYPFAGKMNPSVKLGLVQINRDSIVHQVAAAMPQPASQTAESRDGADFGDADGCTDDGHGQVITAQDISAENWAACLFLDAPREATEYLARVHWLPDGCAVAQWQNRAQTCTVLYRMDLRQQKCNVTSDNLQPGNGRGRTLLVERSDVWINLHHMFHVLSRPIHPDECHLDDISHSRTPPMPNPLPEGSFSFLFASERTGYAHLYLYTYCPGINGEQAILLKCVTSGNWIVENILGVDLEKDVVYFTATYDSVLERHLYAMPVLGITNEHTWRRGATTAPQFDETAHQVDGAVSPSPPTQLSSSDESAGSNSKNGGVRRGLSKVMHALSGKGGRSALSSTLNRHEPVEIALTSNEDDPSGPTRLTAERGMHSIVMDESCRFLVDTSSDLDRPTTVTIYELPTDDRMTVRRIMALYNAAQDDISLASTPGATKADRSTDLSKCLPAPDLLSFPTSDGTETLHAALYRPDARIHGPGPYPLVCAVYGGPHVQRVNRSWAQSADMRAQRLRSLGFCVVKCDNRGSSRRGLAFESAISRRLGRLEVLDQVAVVRQLIVRGIVDPARVGVYGWSYGGYLSAMCLCRAPDVFHVAVAGAPVSSWDGYDTHYTERYMGLPADNAAGYRESAVFDHVPNMRGKLMIVHGLIDENVHFRHTSRLINKLIAAGKDYDLLIFPEERHSPRRLRDRIYMEQRISEYFVRHLGTTITTTPTALDIVTASLGQGGVSGLRAMAGHL